MLTLKELDAAVGARSTASPPGRGVVAGLGDAAIAIIADRLIQTAARQLAAQRGGPTREP
jgi:ABC-type proline/glycine betaine transport system permease subunit